MPRTGVSETAATQVTGQLQFAMRVHYHFGLQSSLLPHDVREKSTRYDQLLLWELIDELERFIVLLIQKSYTKCGSVTRLPRPD
jgi:hypothetical protein